jgi:hypothetical protein
MSDDALAALRRWRWPGNVRELGNVLERALVLRAPGAAGPISADEVAASLDEAPREPTAAVGTSLASKVDALERAEIESALRRARGVKARAAQALGLSRPALDKKMADLDIDVARSDRLAKLKKPRAAARVRPRPPAVPRNGSVAVRAVRVRRPAPRGLQRADELHDVVPVRRRQRVERCAPPRPVRVRGPRTGLPPQRPSQQVVRTVHRGAVRIRCGRHGVARVADAIAQRPHVVDREVRVGVEGEVARHPDVSDPAASIVTGGGFAGVRTRRRGSCCSRPVRTAAGRGSPRSGR